MAGPTTELIGRESEQARIDAFMTTVPGAPSSLTVTGDSGIGKTALWRYAIARGREQGFRVLVSRPAEEEMPLSGVGLTDLFESVRLVGLTVGTDDLFSTGRAVLAALRGIAADEPLVIAVDDAQWLDSFSTRVLRYALRRIETEPIAIVTTLRSDGAGSDPFASTATLPVDRQVLIEPRPLDLDDIRRLIGDTAGAVPRPTLRRIHRMSGGNPLYALELARTLQTKGPGTSGDPLPLPDSVQKAIGDRIDAHAGDLWPLLEVVSAIGHPSVGSLRDIDLPGDLEQLLAVAQQERLLVVEEDLMVRFSHPIVGSVVYARIDPIARRDLHGRLAELATDPDVRARHLALSSEETDEDVAASLEDAAGRASRRGAPDLAAEFIGHSLRLTPEADGSATRRRRLMQIEDLAASGEAGRALALADGLLASLPHGPDRAAVLVQRFKVEDDDLAFADELLEEALEDAGEDEALRGRVLDMLAWLRGILRGNVRGGIRCAQEGVEIARRTGDEPLRMLAQSSLALMGALISEPRSDLLVESIALEDSVGVRGTNESPRAISGKLLFWAGDLPAARHRFEEAFSAAAREGNELTRPYRLYDLSLLECASGNLQEARELARQGIEAAEDARFPAGSLHYPSGLVSMWLGDADDAWRTADLLQDWAVVRGERPAVVRALMVKGLLSLSEGQTGEASTHLAEAIALLEDMEITAPGAFPVLPDAIEASARSGDLERADSWLARLDSQAEPEGSAWARAAADRCRGLILVSSGRPDEAAAPLRRSVDAFDRLGFRPDAARGVLLLGRALLRGGHRTAAADALVDARDRFASMGAVSWERRALEELERSAPGRGSGELTPTERQIAGLVAEGMQNRQVAQAMFVSVATVEAHLTRIYRKLQIRSRAELTRLVVERDLLGAEED